LPPVPAWNRIECLDRITIQINPNRKVVPAVHDEVGGLSGFTPGALHTSRSVLVVFQYQANTLTVCISSVAAHSSDCDQSFQAMVMVITVSTGS